MCKNWREKGECRYGDRCLFAHGSTELTTSPKATVVKQTFVTPTKESHDADQDSTKATTSDKQDGGKEEVTPQQFLIDLDEV